MSARNYIVTVTAETGEVYRFAMSNYVSGGNQYIGTMTGYPSITESTPTVGAQTASTDSFNCVISNCNGEYSDWIRSRSDSDFVDIVSAVLTCYEVDRRGVETSVFSGKVSTIEIGFDGGTPYIGIRADADGSQSISELIPSSIAIPVNEVPNGDFNTDTESWEAHASAGATVTLSYNPGGGADTRYGFLVATHQAASGDYDIVGAKITFDGDFKEGDKVGISAYIRSETGASRVGTMNVYDPDTGAFLDGFGINMTAANTWYRISHNFTIQTDRTDIEVRVYVSSGAADGEVVWIDHVRLTRPDTFPQDDSIVYEEGMGRPIPFLFGGHRGHFPLVPAIKDPENDYFAHVLCADVDQYLLRVAVSTIYGEDGGLRVLPSSDYSVDRDSYPGRFLVTMDTNKYPALFADAEATEFNTFRSGVERHWLFRDGNRTDEIAAHGLYTTRTSLIGEWVFDGGTLDDSSPSAADLEVVGGGTPNYVDVGGTTDGAIDQNNALYSMDVPTPVKLTLQTPDSSYLNFDKGDSFYVEMRIAAAANYSLDGWVASKMYFTATPSEGLRGWGVTFSGGVPAFILRVEEAGSTTVQHTISGTESLADGNYHTVIASVDRERMVGELWVDSKLVASKTISTSALYGSLENTGDLCILGQNPYITGTYADAKLDYVRVRNTAYSGPTWEVKTDVGHSGTSESAVAMASESYRLEASSSTALDVEAGEDLSLLVWFKCGSNPGSDKAIFFRSTDGSSDGYGFVLHTDGSITFDVIGTTASATATASASLGLTDEKYHCLFGILDVTNDEIRMYVDGVLVDTQTTATLGSIATAGPAYVDGYQGSGTADRLYVDEIMVLIGAATALTATQVRTHYMCATGNPARVIRNIITDTTIGLGETVDSTSFDAAEDTLDEAGIFIGGCITEQTEASNIIELICSLYGAYVKQTGENWTMGFGWQSASGTTHKLGYNDSRSNIANVSNLRRTSAVDLPKNIKCKYRPVVDTKSPGTLRYALSSVLRPVSSTGVNKRVIDLPYVRDPVVADKVAHFISSWFKSDRFMSAALTEDVRSIKAGDSADVTVTDLGFSDAAMLVEEVRRQEDEIEISLRDDSTEAFVYSPKAIPDGYVSEIDPDYSSTVPPAPSDLYVVTNRATERGSVLRVAWTNPTGDLARATVDGIRVYWIIPNDRNNDNLLTGGSFESGFSSWDAVADGGATVTLTHNSSRGKRGQKGYLVATHSAGTFNSIGATQTKTKVSGSYASGTIFEAVGFVRSETGAGRTAKIVVKDEFGTTIGQATKTMTDVDTWYKVKTEATVGTATTELTVEIYVSAGAVSGEVVNIDEVSIAEVLDAEDSGNLDGVALDLPKNATSVYLSSAFTGIEPGQTVWVWVKTFSRWGLDSLSATVVDADAEETYGPNTVLEIEVSTETSDADDAGIQAAFPKRGDAGFEDRIASLEYTGTIIVRREGDAPGTYEANEVIYSVPIGFSQTFRQNLPDSKFICETEASDGNYVITIRYWRGGTPTDVGTVTFTTGSTTGTVSVASDFNLQVDDIFGFVAPSGTDSTFERFKWFMVGERD